MGGGFRFGAAESWLACGKSDSGGFDWVRPGARWCARWMGETRETPMLRKQTARFWCAEVDVHGLEARVTGEPLAQHEAAVADGAEDVRTLRAVIYTYWARCAPGWCWRAARARKVVKGLENGGK